jgi:hypothetical protein
MLGILVVPLAMRLQVTLDVMVGSIRLDSGLSSNSDGLHCEWLRLLGNGADVQHYYFIVCYRVDLVQ